MKKNFSILFTLLFLQTWSQENKSLEYQKKTFDEANEYLKKLEYSSAAGAFQYVNELNPKNEIGKIALKKSDSLRPIARQKLKESLIGKWKLAETGSNWGMEKTQDTLIEKILIIDENKFHFYEKNVKTKEIKLVKSEKMNFSKGINENFYSYEFVFSDNQIWYFSVNPKTNKLRQVNTGEDKEIGRSEIVCGNLELYYTRILY
ncbi:hypothetical protein EOD40_08435 [Flavobacterium sufflavum]|uniref:Uncharacterized protein n=1 Tax=Flavobacterium sufflavum TaxID=1921138 RepID=A0A3S2U2V4_9FLAO|nr:hypothetical protein [Flavobacterium sufflavum]RVT76522.1 hypothetical protein EOD40_08435 [Flavobacterium sufflavum]